MKPYEQIHITIEKMGDGSVKMEGRNLSTNRIIGPVYVSSSLPVINIRVTENGLEIRQQTFKRINER